MLYYEFLKKHLKLKDKRENSKKLQIALIVFCLRERKFLLIDFLLQYDKGKVRLNLYVINVNVLNYILFFNATIF